ncbi:FAD-dependent monooxygenase [Streptomyces sp. JV176]|uniref:FAD-dependent monooxygenase n=1 Tax=Streptomyces sp. JV176 TaxID=858630 RepID=UPI002E79F716|nr:FAD-dependent monooxygenase [Streptomyces sp. JV176]MEE1804724.1 FAD-dependent monooxygenase [Streptomyces sp. JV176]
MGNRVRTREEVVVVGGGPVGLWLAAELRLGGVSVTVLEARAARGPHSRALTVHPRTIENLAFRGVAEPFLAEGVRIPEGHFGGLAERMDFATLDTPFPFTLALPQARTEELLEAHARAAGARVLRGHRVTGLAQGADGAETGPQATSGAGAGSVTVQVEGPDGPYALEAAYVVGCDGTRSTVRAAAGIDFPGTDATIWGWLGDVVLDDPPAEVGLTVWGPRGGLLAVRIPGGLHRFVGATPEDFGAAPAGDPTLEELRTKVAGITGRDFGMRDPVWLSRFGNATRQAARYRAGRVLLAGDAAHMHFPSGGVGLNVGIQDATNLGWKLAATVRGTAPAALLDSYHDERHPVGAELLESTRAQTALMTGFSTEGLALRAFIGGRIASVPAFSQDLAERLSGLAVAYPPAPGDPVHPLTGRRAPDLALDPAGAGGAGGAGAEGPADGPYRLFDLLRDGRHVLLDLAGSPDLAEGGGGRGEGTPETPPGTVPYRARLTSAHPGWSGVGAVLVRPDGHVAWAADAADAAPPTR